MTCVNEGDNRPENSFTEEESIAVKLAPRSDVDKIGEAIVVRMAERDKNWGTRKKYRIFRKVGKNWK